MLDIILKRLGSAGLNLVKGLVMKKGTDKVRELTGIDLSKPELSSEDLGALKKYEAENAPKILEMIIERDMHSETQVTKRHKTDMLSDSVLSKNIRPMSLIYWSLMCLVAMIFVTFYSAPMEIFYTSCATTGTILAFYVKKRSDDKQYTIANIASNYIGGPK